jgi:Tfp pilus assembly protein PilP
MPGEEHMPSTKLEFVRNRLEQELKKMENAPVTPKMKKKIEVVLMDTLEIMTMLTERKRIDALHQKGTKVWDRGRTKCGVVIGTKNCRLEGCNGTRLITRWPDGRQTHPCTKGMKLENGEWEIE